MSGMSSFKLRLFVGFISCLFCMASCGGRTGEAKVRLSSNERALMDSMYIQQIEVLRPMWDSLCEARFETGISTAVDSLIRTRIAEEVQLRARINKQE